MLDFSGNRSHGITPVTDPYTNKKYLPGTNMTVEWDPDLHGSGGSDVSAHYARKRQTDTGAYTADQVQQLDTQRAWQEAFRENPQALFPLTEETPETPDFSGGFPTSAWENLLETNPGAVLSLATPQQALDTWLDYSEAWSRGERNETLGRAFGTREFQDLIDARVQKGDEGLSVDDWFWAKHSQFHHDPLGFQQWSEDNPDMAIRWHALAGTGRYQTSSTNWGDFEWSPGKHKDFANALAYQKSQELGYGEDGKKDGRIVVGDFDSVEDVSSEGGWGDFWNLSGEHKLTDGLWNFVEENPVETAAAVAALVAAPYATAALTNAGMSLGAAGVLSGAGTGAISSAALESVGPDSNLLKAGLEGAVVGGLMNPDAVNYFFSDLYGVSPTLAGTGNTFVAGVATGKNAQEAALDALTYFGSTQTGQYLNSAGNQPASTVLDEWLPESLAKPVGEFVDSTVTPVIEEFKAAGEVGLNAMSDAAAAVLNELDINTDGMINVGQTEVIPQDVQDLLVPIREGLIDFWDVATDLGQGSAETLYAMIFGVGALNDVPVPTPADTMGLQGHSTVTGVDPFVSSLDLDFEEISQGDFGDEFGENAGGGGDSFGEPAAGRGDLGFGSGVRNDTRNEQTFGPTPLDQTNSPSGGGGGGFPIAASLMGFLAGDWEQNEYPLVGTPKVNRIKTRPLWSWLK